MVLSKRSFMTLIFWLKASLGSSGTGFTSGSSATHTVFWQGAFFKPETGQAVLFKRSQSAKEKKNHKSALKQTEPPPLPPEVWPRMLIRDFRRERCERLHQIHVLNRQSLPPEAWPRTLIRDFRGNMSKIVPNSDFFQ